LEIIFLESIDSTHTYLKNHIKKNGYTQPFCVVTNQQTDGKGSRNRSWLGKKGNLFFSFVYDKKELPCDLLIQSSSIYFSFFLKEVLSQYGSKVWLKWPNDFYIEKKKIGGTITHLVDDKLYCGIGLNLHFVDDHYGYLDIPVDQKKLLEDYFSILTQKISWKQIFSKYSIEFAKSREFETTIQNEKVSMRKAILENDGSIIIDKKKVFSLR
jgi:BirA family biotin operon repressor/biotin-[acetyl-CoA-carboxylase] ligase